MYVQQTAIRPDLTFSDILWLDFDVNATYEVAVVTLVATGLKTIWDRRKEGKTVSPIHIKARGGGKEIYTSEISFPLGRKDTIGRDPRLPDIS